MSDVALGPNGTLRGRVVDGTGAPKAGVELAVFHDDQRVGSTRAARNGEFAFSGLHGGLHQVTTPDGAFACRFWSPDTAPPNAERQVVFVDDQGLPAETYPGNQNQPGPACNQCGSCGPTCAPGCQRRRGGRPFGFCLNNPVVVLGLIATAVAIPVAISAHRKQSGS